MSITVQAVGDQVTTQQQVPLCSVKADVPDRRGVRTTAGQIDLDRVEVQDQIKSPVAHLKWVVKDASEVLFPP